MWNRRYGKSKLDREVAQLRQEFDAISEGLRLLAKRQGGHAAGRAGSWLDQGMSYFSPRGLDQLSRSAARGAGQVTHQLEDVLGAAVHEVSKRPVPAGLVLLALGLMVGLVARKAAGS